MAPPSVRLFVEVRLPRAWPSRKDRGDREAIIEELDAIGIGECGGSGGGMGAFDFSYEVQDEEEAREMIECVIRERLGDVEFTIDAFPEYPE